MKRTTADGDTVFLKHHFPLEEDRIAKLVLPIDLSFREAVRLRTFIFSLLIPVPRLDEPWPFGSDDISLCDDEDDDEDEEEDDFGGGIELEPLPDDVPPDTTPTAAASTDTPAG